MLPLFFHFFAFNNSFLKRGNKVEQIHSHKIYYVDSLMHRATKGKEQVFYHAHDEKGNEVKFLPFNSIRRVEE